MMENKQDYNGVPYEVYTSQGVPIKRATMLKVDPNMLPEFSPMSMYDDELRAAMARQNVAARAFLDANPSKQLGPIQIKWHGADDFTKNQIRVEVYQEIIEI